MIHFFSVEYDHNLGYRKIIEQLLDQKFHLGAILKR